MILPNPDKYNTPYKIAVSTVLLLTVFSVICYKQRMFFVDPCWITFNIINTKTFSIPEYRFGSFISQIFPLVGVYLGLSVKSLLIIYSASFYIFYLGTMLLAGAVWKQKWLGILLAIYLTLFVSDVYFWPNNEVHQGIAWMVLFLSFYNYRQERRNNLVVYFLLFLFLFLAISSHLLVAPPLLFLWLYTNIDKHKRLNSFFKHRLGLFFSIVLLTLIIIRYKLSTDGWYDGVKLQAVKSLSLQGVISSFSSKQANFFLGLVIANYWVAIPLLYMGAFFLVKRRKYLQLLLTTAFIAGYFSLICITYPNSVGRQILFYMESEWMALSIIIATPFILSNGSIWERQKLITVIFLLFFSIRLGYIANSYSYFNYRYKQLEALIIKQYKKGEQKTLIVMENKLSDSLFIMDWGLPVESIMLAKTKKIAPITIKRIAPTTQVNDIRDSFHSCFSVEPISYLNNSYFKLDSTKRYKIISKW